MFHFFPDIILPNFEGFFQRINIYLQERWCDHFNTPKFGYDYAWNPEGWCDNFVFTTTLLFCFQSAKYEKNKENFTILQFSQDLSKQLMRRCDIWSWFLFGPGAVFSFCECRRTPPVHSYETSSCCQSDPTVRKSPGPRTEQRSEQSKSRVRVKAPDKRFFSELPHSENHGDIGGLFIWTHIFPECCRLPVQFHLLVKHIYEMIEVLSITNEFWANRQGHWLTLPLYVVTDLLPLCTFSFHFFGR